VLGALVGLVSALVLFAPARWLAGAIEKATGGHLLLAEARGTVWNGSAQLSLTGGAGSTDAIGSAEIMFITMIQQKSSS